MRERPILFSGPMVRALLDGRMTQTRRVVKPQPLRHLFIAPCWGQSPDGVPFGQRHLWTVCGPDYPDGPDDELRCPYGVPGDRLWVKETWADVNLLGAPALAYRANSHIRDLMDEPDWLDERGAFNYDDPRMAFGKAGLRFSMWSTDLLSGVEGHHWRSPLHMPRWASRLTLEITDVRVERLQDISAADSLAEGVACPTCEAMAASACGGRGCFASIAAYRGLWENINGPVSWAANPWVWAVSFKVVDHG